MQQQQSRLSGLARQEREAPPQTLLPPLLQFHPRFKMVPGAHDAKVTPPPRKMFQAELLQQPERAQTLSDSYTEKYFVGFSAGADLHPTPHDLSIHGRRALFDFCETRHMMRSSKYASPKHWFRVNFKNAILLSTKPIQKCTIFSTNKNGPFGVTWVKIG